MIGALTMAVMFSLAPSASASDEEPAPDDLGCLVPTQPTQFVCYDFAFDTSGALVNNPAVTAGDRILSWGVVRIDIGTVGAPLIGVGLGDDSPCAMYSDFDCSVVTQGVVTEYSQGVGGPLICYMRQQAEVYHASNAPEPVVRFPVIVPQQC